ncbi:MAG: flagellar basal body P-ring protein FlgI [Gammaproteobacteria bacterium]|nr:flagellar basal body P-ring protein FlgI [Gammaproteobacteria bacterium]MBT5205227.1 flagellar basal body P-ring protein FlgI [Gammaproteobacteria bacterium]MBT5601444.1 flagellar basal body P-ring protein FlgI [Gammaproteobacteria bacterium]MBT6245938.1 flagellar basal body P-ring protein FlgI [Gammaproteobacteria bacterium]
MNRPLQNLNRWSVTAVLSCLVISMPVLTASAARIKDVADIAGVRSNQIVGYGLVVGLAGTGDQTTQTPFTIQSLKSMLQQLGVTIPSNVNPQLKNVAAVVVHAEIPAFAKPGQFIDVTVSSIGNSQSLRGGALLMTPMKGVDGLTYAIAQGNLIVGGFGVQGEDGSSVTVNIPSAGNIPNGGQIEREIESAFVASDLLQLDLKKPDFTTAQRLADRINKELGPDTAIPMDGSSVRIMASLDIRSKVALMSTLENLEFEPGRASARVIINSRTGTVVIGEEVRIYPSAVAHGSLTVSVTENLDVSQPGAFADGGQTVVTPDTAVDIEVETNPMFVFDPGVSLDELVRAVNQVGAAPGDLVAILEALERAGALQAELVVI